jgi:hypothetical protein
MPTSMSLLTMHSLDVIQGRLKARHPSLPDEFSACHDALRYSAAQACWLIWEALHAVRRLLHGRNLHAASLFIAMLCCLLQGAQVDAATAPGLVAKGVMSPEQQANQRLMERALKSIHSNMTSYSLMEFACTGERRRPWCVAALPQQTTK